MRRGGAWETQLEHLHDRYRRDRRAVILRAHPAVKVLGQRGKAFTGVWASDGPPDFIGALGDGRAVAFDAKDTHGARFPFSMLARHQARDLEAVHLAGGVAFIALRFGGQPYVLPWAELGPRYWRWTETKGAPASVTPSAWWFPFDVAGDGWLPHVSVAS